MISDWVLIEMENCINALPEHQHEDARITTGNRHGAFYKAYRATLEWVLTCEHRERVSVQSVEMDLMTDLLIRAAANHVDPPSGQIKGRPATEG